MRKNSMIVVMRKIKTQYPRPRQIKNCLIIYMYMYVHFLSYITTRAHQTLHHNLENVHACLDDLQNEF